MKGLPILPALDRPDHFPPRKQGPEASLVLPKLTDKFTIQ